VCVSSTVTTATAIMMYRWTATAVFQSFGVKEDALEGLHSEMGPDGKR